MMNIFGQNEQCYLQRRLDNVIRSGMGDPLCDFVVFRNGSILQYFGVLMLVTSIERIPTQGAALCGVAGDLA